MSVEQYLPMLMHFVVCKSVPFTNMISIVARCVVVCEEERRRKVTRYVQEYRSRKCPLELLREMEKAVLKHQVAHVTRWVLCRHLHLLHTSFQHKVTGWGAHLAVFGKSV